jgi:hypothetical protein
VWQPLPGSRSALTLLAADGAVWAGHDAGVERVGAGAVAVTA